MASFVMNFEKSCAVIIFLTFFLGSSAYSVSSQFDADATAKGAILGRAVEIPARDYRNAFSVKPPVLGECALKMEGGTIKTCSEKFTGEEVLIPRASTDVDFSRVQTVDDVLTEGMGGIGVSIGLLGLVSAGVKANVAARTQTNNKRITFMSSYELKTGLLTLRDPKPVTEIGDNGALYLSEIELGGNEVLQVSMEFESVKKRTDVSVTVTVKILFWKISKKMRYIKEHFGSSSSARVLFVSSFRGTIDKTFTDLDDAIAEVEKIEEMYVNGPKELKKLKPTDEKLHNTYYFASWKRSPYGENMNRVIADNDLGTLRTQFSEMEAVINQIDYYQERGPWVESRGKSMENMKSSLTSLKKKLSDGIQTYYGLTADQRKALFDLYGASKAPGYYQRRLRNIMGY